MTMFTRDGLIDMLRHNIVTVTFTKVNGDERIMTCTLQSDQVPVFATVNGQVVVKESKNNTISVWDINAQGWRSFRVENVKSISMG